MSHPQVIPNNATTNASGTQQVGVTRIVNIAGTPPRNAVGIAGTSPHSSPAVSRAQNSTKLMLTTSPKLVRNVFVAPISSSSSSSQVSSPQMQVQSPSPPARKRLKLSETTEKLIPFDASGYRRRIMEHKMRRMRSVREKYAENASELFFLHAGGNMMDYHTWRKRSPTPQFVHFLRQHRLDPDDNDEDLTAPLSSEFSQLSAVTTTVATTVATTVTSAIVTATTAVTTVTSGSTVVQIPNQRAEVKIAGAGVTPVAVSTTLPAAALAQLSHQGNYLVITTTRGFNSCRYFKQSRSDVYINSNMFKEFKEFDITFSLFKKKSIIKSIIKIIYVYHMLQFLSISIQVLIQLWWMFCQCHIYSLNSCESSCLMFIVHSINFDFIF